MILSTMLTVLLTLGSYESLPTIAEAPQDPGVRVFSTRSSRSYIGVSIQSLTSKLAKANGNKVDEGAIINEVESESPAAKAGLEEGDVVVQFGERMIYDADDLQKAVSRVKPGTKVDVKVDRKGSSKTVAVTVGKNPNRARGFFSHDGIGSYMFGSTRAIGAELRSLNEQLGAYFGVPEGKGVLVESVKKDGAAEKAGLMAGDVIVKVADEPVEELGDVWEILTDYEDGEKVNFDVIRKGSSKKVTIELEEDNENGYFYKFRSSPHNRWEGEEMGDAMRFELKELPRIDIERHMPELDELKFKMDRFKNDIRIKIDPKIKIEKILKDKIQRRI